MSYSVARNENWGSSAKKEERFKEGRIEEECEDKGGSHEPPRRRRRCCRVG